MVERISPLAETGLAPGSSSFRTIVDPVASLLDVTAKSEIALAVLESRYEKKGTLGSGGMGTVDLVLDRNVGRSIAIKRVRAEHHENYLLRTRFLREARVQGQLEHPSIVPVYDLGTTEDGVPFFTMRRVRGRTLEEIIAGVRDGKLTDAEYSQRRLLQAFVSACLAIDYAHSRGVVHRDIKPANLMLGDFGEVYVLDWGIAKVLGVADAEGGEPLFAVEAGQTAQGDVLGTFGYMPPEQVKGTDVTAQADVYALGATLFELLALESLHSMTDLRSVILSTERGVDVRDRLGKIGSAIPAELTPICAEACANSLGERTPSARALANAIEKYLDGDQERARRKVASSALVEDVRNIVSHETITDELEARKKAFQKLGEAVALDPDNSEARDELVALLRHPPDATIREVEDDLENKQLLRAKVSYRSVFGGYIAMAIFSVIPLFVGVKDFTLFWCFAAALFVGLVTSFTLSKRPDWHRLFYLQYAIFAFIIFLVSRAFSPLLVAPLFVIGGSMGGGVLDRFSDRLYSRILEVGMLVGVIVAELTGFLPRTFRIERGVIEIFSPFLRLDRELPATMVISACILGTYAVSVAMAVRVHKERADAERKAEKMLWQLRHIAPGLHSRTSLPAAPKELIACETTEAFLSKSP